MISTKSEPEERQEKDAEEERRERCSMMAAYEDEDKIVWLKDRDALARMGYVRERWILTSIRTGPVKVPNGEVLIGYAVLKKSAAKGEKDGFCRRVFTLLPEELRLEIENRFGNASGALQYSAIQEAVDPLLVEAGKPSRRII